MSFPLHETPAPQIVRPSGQLIGGVAELFKEEARTLLTRGDVLVDLSDVSFADSEGLSALVALYKTAAQRKRRFALFSVRYNMRALLRLTRLHRVFEVHENEEAALKAYPECPR